MEPTFQQIGSDVFRFGFNRRRVVFAVLVNPHEVHRRPCVTATSLKLRITLYPVTAKYVARVGWLARSTAWRLGMPLFMHHQVQIVNVRKQSYVGKRCLARICRRGATSVLHARRAIQGYLPPSCFEIKGTVEPHLECIHEFCEAFVCRQTACERQILGKVLMTK